MSSHSPFPGFIVFDYGGTPIPLGFVDMQQFESFKTMEPRDRDNIIMINHQFQVQRGLRAWMVDIIEKASKMVRLSDPWGRQQLTGCWTRNIGGRMVTVKFSSRIEEEMCRRSGRGFTDFLFDQQLKQDMAYGGPRPGHSSRDPRFQDGPYGGPAFHNTFGNSPDDYPYADAGRCADPHCAAHGPRAGPSGFAGGRGGPHPSPFGGLGDPDDSPYADTGRCTNPRCSVHGPRAGPSGFAGGPPQPPFGGLFNEFSDDYPYAEAGRCASPLCPCHGPRAGLSGFADGPRPPPEWGSGSPPPFPEFGGRGPRSRPSPPRSENNTYERRGSRASSAWDNGSPPPMPPRGDSSTNDQPRVEDVKEIEDIFRQNIDPYRELEVSPAASTDEIKKSYRKMSMKHHPDRAMNKAAAAQKMARINTANDILSNATKRKLYDRVKADGGPGLRGAGGFQGGAGGYRGGPTGAFAGPRAGPGSRPDYRGPRGL